MNEVGEREYRSQPALGWGPAVWREMLEEQRGAGELVWRLFIRDFTARYKQSILGVLWAVTLPLFMLATFVVLGRAGLINIGVTPVPYVAFALLGLTVWQLFAAGVVGCANAVVAGGSMVVKIKFPRETLVVAALGQAVFETLLRVAFLVPVFAYYAIAPKWTAIFLPLVLVPLLALTVGLGFVLALLNCLVRDVGYALPVAMTFLMLLTPVMYPAGHEGLPATLTAVNPLATFVTAARDVVIHGSLTEPGRFAAASGFAAMTGLLGWRVFHLAEPKLAEWV